MNKLRNALLALSALALFGAGHAQASPTNNNIVIVSSPPTGSCTSNEIRIVKASGVTGGDQYACLGGVWTRMPIGVNELSATNSPAANLCVTVDPATPTKFQFVTCGSGGGSGGTSNVKECSGTPPCQSTGNTTSSATTLAFGPGFDVSTTATVSSQDTANITLDYSENPVNLSGTNVTSTLPVGNGGTGGTTQAGARSGLGLVIGADVQAYDPELQSLASAIIGTNGQVWKSNGSVGSWQADSTGSSPTFDGIANGTNTTANAMVVGGSAALYTSAIGSCAAGSICATTATTASNFAGTGSTNGTVELGTGEVTGTLTVNKGGTGLTNITQGDVLYSSSTGVYAGLAKDANSTRYLSNQGTLNGPSWNQVNLANGVTNGAGNGLLATNGGTGRSTWTIGDLSYAASTNPTALTPLTFVATSHRYLGNSNGSTPSWGTIDLSDGVGTSILAATNGGTGLATGISGGIPYFSSSTTIASSGVLANNGVVIGSGAGLAPRTSATTINAAGTMTLATGQFIDIAADATNGGSLTLKEGVDDGSDSWVLKIADSGGTANTTVTINSDGTLPTSAIGGATASKCARFNGSGVLVPASGDCTNGDTTGAGFADPGSNGFVDRTALNVSAARTLTGSTDVAVTNGGGGGNPVFSFTRTATTASAALGANVTTFGTTGVLFEGSTSDGAITLLTAADPGADRTITLPNETGTVCTTGSICSAYAGLAAPALTGAPTVAGAPSFPDNSTKIATTAFVTSAIIRTDEATFVIFDPTTADTNKASIQIPKNSTVTRISCSSTGTSTTINIDKRDETTPNSAGTNLLSTSLACDPSSETSCSSGCDHNFLQNTSITGHQLLNLQISAVAGTPTVVRVNVEYTTP